MLTIDAVLARLEGVRKSGAGWIAKCPAHDDRHASLSIREGERGRVLLHCFADCTFRDIVCTLGLYSPSWSPPSPLPRRGVVPEQRASAFSATDAQLTWQLALTRARSDEPTIIDADRDAYAYLRSRGLLDAWDDRAFGLLAAGMQFHPTVRWWPDAGYRILAPLFDLTGRVVNVQARRIVPGEPKTLFPKGTTSRGVAFANEQGRVLLHGESVAVLCLSTSCCF